MQRANSEVPGPKTGDLKKRLCTGEAKDNNFKGAGRRGQFNVAFGEDFRELRTPLTPCLEPNYAVADADTVCHFAYNNTASRDA